VVAMGAVISSRETAGAGFDMGAAEAAPHNR
jgi:hypothetical protein